MAAETWETRDGVITTPGVASFELVPAPWGNRYLRLLELDLEDEEAIDDWVAACGPMGWCWRPSATLDDREPAGITGPLGAHPVENPALAALVDARTALPDPEAPFETVAEFRLAARMLRDVARLWLRVSPHLQDDGTLGDPDAEPLGLLPDEAELELRWESELGIGSDEQLSHLDVVACAELLCELLTLLLGQFQPALSLARSSADDASEGDARGPFVSGYACIAAEIYNELVARVHYRQCGNDHCGRWFSKQEGRAKTTRRRSTGLVYCSARCARAQTQRNYRRRQRAAEASSGA